MFKFLPKTEITKQSAVCLFPEKKKILLNSFIIMFCYNYNAKYLSLLEIKYNIQNACIFNTTMSIHCWWFFLIFRIYFIFFLWKRGGGS